MPNFFSLLKIELFRWGDVIISLDKIVYFLSFFFLAFLTNKVLKRLIHRVFIKSTVDNLSNIETIIQITSYINYFIFTLIALNKIGINITVLLAGSTALMLGIGIGLQQNIQNLMAGLTVLLDGTLKVGHIVNYKGVLAKVTKVNLRTSILETKEGVSIIIPNSKVISEVIENVSYNKKPSLFSVTVGVDYDSDPILVTNTLIKIAQDTNKILNNPAPFVRFVNYAESSMVFQLFFSTTAFFEIENINSILRYKIYYAFKKKGIKIPFPQRVVHLEKAPKDKLRK